VLERDEQPCRGDVRRRPRVDPAIDEVVGEGLDGVAIRLEGIVRDQFRGAVGHLPGGRLVMARRDEGVGPLGEQ